MTISELVTTILKALEILTAWPVLLFLGLYLLRNQISLLLPDLAKRLSKAPGGWEFSSLQEVRAEVATLVNQAEISQDIAKANLKVDPKSIRLRHTSVPDGPKYWKVKVWLDAPADFVSEIEKVTFERHPTFKNRYKDVTSPPFADSFKCWGEFTIRAAIRLRDGQMIKRQRYLALQVDGDSADA